jgi:cytochrome P450
MTTAAAPGGLYYDPFDHVVDEHAQGIWRQMRDEAPLYWNDEHRFYALSRYDDVLEAILDTETYSSAHGTVLDGMNPVAGTVPMMIWMDAPEHTWHRKLVSRAFTTRTVAVLEERVSRMCRSLLDAQAGSEGFDFLDDYAAIIPPTVILALLGFPEGFEEDWRHGIDDMFHAMGERGAEDPKPPADRGDLIGQGGALGTGVFEALPGLMEQRRRDPQDDLISTLVNTELEMDDGTKRPLDDFEITMFIHLIAIAGTETVARLLGWAAVLLAEHPGERQKLLDDPDLITNAVEECLRYEAPSPVNGRWLTRDVELYGQILPKDSKVLLLNGSGNRDERHFPAADRFDVTRQIDRHLSFGYGAHFCIGAALARVEARIALREFLERYPSYEIAPQGPTMLHTSTVRGFARVPVTF